LPASSTATQNPGAHDKAVTEAGEVSIETGALQSVPSKVLAFPTAFTAAQKLDEAQET
jgi:hypothetical protein